MLRLTLVLIFMEYARLLALEKGAFGQKVAIVLCTGIGRQTSK